MSGIVIATSRLRLHAFYATDLAALVAALIEYGLDRLELPSLRAYADPANTASQKLLPACGMAPAGAITLTHPTHHSASQAPLFRITNKRVL